MRLHLFVVQDLIVQIADRPSEQLTPSQSWNMDSKFIIYWLWQYQQTLCLLTNCSCRYSAG